MKHPHVIQDTSKTSTSVMFAGTASGHLLPPYVVYKSTYLYPTWIEGGMDGSRYNRTNSGWFEMPTFEDWFNVIIVPYVKNLAPGSKVIIGDNLCSHLSIAVIKKCKEFNIKFVLLPPNSTHLCQPLDVAFFRPVKIAWRKTLLEWKKNNRGVPPKSEFPLLLKKTIESITNREANLKQGFEASGIFPINPSEVLNKIPTNLTGTPESSPEVSNIWTQAFVTLMEKGRYNENIEQRSKQRGKRINIVAGRSVSARDLEEETTSDEEEVDEPEGLNDSSSTTSAEESSDSSSDLLSLASSSSKDPSTSKAGADLPVPVIVKKDDYVLVQFGTNKSVRSFIGLVLSVSGDQIRVKCMRKREGTKFTYFVYPNIEDVSFVNRSQIIKRLVLSTSRRGQHVFLNADDQNIE